MIRKILPYFIFKRLFGDRIRFQSKFNPKDKDWMKWKKQIVNTYTKRNNRLINKIVEGNGYKILKNVNLQNKTIFEIGPGRIEHMKYWNNKPKKYILGDINKRFLSISSKRIKSKKIKTEKVILNYNNKIKLKNNSVDIIISFYSFEHIHNLNFFIKEYYRILKKNGCIVFAIPNEGSVAWGLGRYLINRREVINKLKINHDKIICWEHPNFADDILKAFSKYFKLQKIQNFPNLFLDDFILVKKGIFYKN